MSYSGYWQHEMFSAWVRAGFFHLLSYDVDSFLTHMYWSVQRERCEGSLPKISKVLSLSSSLFSMLLSWDSLVLHPENSVHLSLKFSTSSSQLRRMLDPEFSLLKVWQEILSMQWVGAITGLTSFVSLLSRITFLVFSVFQCLKSVVLNVLSKFLQVLCWTVNYGWM